MTVEEMNFIASAFKYIRTGECPLVYIDDIEEYITRKLIEGEINNGHKALRGSCSISRRS